MEKIIGTVYNVSRVMKTKSVGVGDFKTIDEAEKAMVEHYDSTAKRGDFYYRISQCELEEMEGVVFRRMTLSLCGTDKQYYKRYPRNELDYMTASSKQKR